MMSKHSLMLIGAALAGAVSVTVLAQTPASPPPMPSSPGKTTMGTAHEGAMGRHDMTGTVRRIDHQTGAVELDSRPVNLTLHFPPDAIKDLEPGDKITVHLGFSK